MSSLIYTMLHRDWAQAKGSGIRERVLMAEKAIRDFAEQ